MEKFIPYEKLSKKKKREFDRKRRVEWNMNPVTRRPENPKAYKRRKTRLLDDSSSGSFVYCRRPAERGDEHPPAVLRERYKEKAPAGIPCKNLN